MYNQLGHFKIFLIFSVWISILEAGTFSEFKRSESDLSVNYTDEKDLTFVKSLESEWEAYVSKKPFSLYKESKPSDINSARHREVDKLGPKVIIKIKENSKEKIKLVLKKDIQKKDLLLDFFGTTLSFNIPDGMQKAKFAPQSQKGIKNFFDSIVVSDYEALITEIKRVSKELNLNDWGKYLLIKEISEKIFTNQDNSRLLSWFIFNKLGYSVRAGIVPKHVVLMNYSKKLIYSSPYYIIDEKKYYVISDYSQGGVEQVFTYKDDYPDSNKELDLSIKTLPNFKEDLKTKLLTFKQYGKIYNIKYRYNQNLIDFMSTYPQADYATFFNAPLDFKTYKDIATELKKHINSKQASVAINFVLNFVQNAFKYEVDDKQFGREKVMFAQETLYYNKSDSEDRAILFSYLVKELFNIGVVGIKYKDHMSTGLYIPMDGDSVNVYTKRFVISDPTYVNAIVGQSLPKYKHIKPEDFIVVNKYKLKKI